MNLVQVRRLRKENRLPIPPMSLHTVFMGNPGTGKTTVARIISGLYAAIGVLEKGSSSRSTAPGSSQATSGRPRSRLRW